MVTEVKRMENWRDWFKTRAATRLALWFAISLMFSVIFFNEFWTNLPTMLSIDWVLGQYNASPWGVLGLCLIFLWLKRREVWERMGDNTNYAFVPVGVVLIAGAVLMPSNRDYLVFQVLLASLGFFFVIFGRAARIPSILVAIYSFAISFPLVVERFAEGQYAQTAIVPVMNVTGILGYPFHIAGQWLHFTSLSGEQIRVVVTAACAGPATMGVFIALFTIMMMDMPLPGKKAMWIFLFGVVGTWIQNVVRVMIVLLAGYYLGEKALWTMHYWTIYVLFPLWYLLFAYIYFRQSGRLQRLPGQRTDAVTAGHEGL